MSKFGVIACMMQQLAAEEYDFSNDHMRILVEEPGKQKFWLVVFLDKAEAYVETYGPATRRHRVSIAENNWVDEVAKFLGQPN
jgi:hypothetical protein